MEEAQEQAKTSDGHLGPGDKDEFEYRDYSKALGEQLLAVKAPFTLGIFGGWGQGKTSLMRFIEDFIRTQKTASGEMLATCIWFDAWKYDREESVWRALLAQSLGDLKHALQACCESCEDKAKKKDIQSYLKDKLEPLEEQLYRSFSRTEKGPLSVDKGEFIKQLAIYGVKTTVPFAGSLQKLYSWLKTLSDEQDQETASGSAGEGEENEGSGDGADADAKAVEKLFGLIKREQTQSFYAHIRHIEEFKQNFEELVKNSLDFLGGERLVIFIDDLDRCEPQKAIEVLEAIKLFLETPQTVFVIGVDDMVVQEGLKQRYQNSFGLSGNGRDDEEPSRTGGRSFHREYLEKIIQLPFTLPALPEQDVGRFLQERINEEFFPNAKLDLVKFFCDTCDFNPRKLKRICHLLDLNWRVVKQRGIEAEIQPLLLAKLVVIQVNQRELYDRLLKKGAGMLHSLETAFTQADSKSTGVKHTGQSVEGMSDATEEEGEGEPEREKSTPLAEAGDLALRPYLDLGWLKEVLEWGKDSERENTKLMCFFNDLQQQGSIYSHLQLRARETTLDHGPAEEGRDVPESSPEEIGEVPAPAPAARKKPRLDSSVLRDLLHEDRDVIASAVDRLLQSDRPAYAAHLLEQLNDVSVPWRQRVSAGDALGYLGDPRLELPLWQRDEDWIAIEDGKFFRGVESPDAPGVNEDDLDGKIRDAGAFSIARYPVTNQDWLVYVAGGEGPVPKHWQNRQIPWGLANHPVVNISWTEAKGYIAWLNQQGAKKGTYHLPTEAQWERAARGPALIKGRENRRLYPWGEQFDPHRCNTRESGLERTTAVGCFMDGASHEGLLDMAGNVFEWCEDKYDEEYYQQGRTEANTQGKGYVIRGGSFDDDQQNASCVYRNYSFDEHFNDFGFRVARI